MRPSLHASFSGILLSLIPLAFIAAIVPRSALAFVVPTHKSPHVGLPSHRGLIPPYRRCSKQIQGSELNHASVRPLIHTINHQTELSAFRWDWDGDDIRWSTKMKRNVMRSFDFSRQPVRNSLILVNIALYLYQVLIDISWIRTSYPSVWPNQAPSIIFDVLMGRTKSGPLTKDFMYASFLAQQPHRFVTAGFLHGSIFHLLVNMDSIRRLPNWLETGLGAPLYLTIFLTSVVAGFAADLATTLDHTAVVGASGGICGLYGLLYVCLVRMENTKAAWRILANMAVLFVLGALVPNVSNIGHAGGFGTGIVLGILMGPRYRKSYTMRRKNSLEVDLYSRDYRAAMGFDRVPSKDGIIPLAWALIALLTALCTQAKIRSIPLIVVQGLLRPGSVLQRL